MGLDLTLAAGGRDIVLVEGPFDVMAVGSPIGVGLHGTNITPDLQHLLLENFDRFVLFLDPDEAGINGSSKIYAMLLSAGKKVAWIKGHQDDPASLGKAKCAQIVRLALSKF